MDGLTVDLIRSGPPRQVEPASARSRRLETDSRNDANRLDAGVSPLERGRVGLLTPSERSRSPSTEEPSDPVARAKDVPEAVDRELLKRVIERIKTTGGPTSIQLEFTIGVEGGVEIKVLDRETGEVIRRISLGGASESSPPFPEAPSPRLSLFA